MLSCNRAPTDSAERGIHTRWYQAQLGDAEAPPAVGGDVVYFGTGDGHVVARDRATGAARWTTRVADGERIDGATLVARGGVGGVGLGGRPPNRGRPVGVGARPERG